MDNNCIVCEESTVSPPLIYFSGKCITPSECPNGAFDMSRMRCNVTAVGGVQPLPISGGVTLAIYLGIVGCIVIILCIIFYFHKKQQDLLRREALLVAAQDAQTQEVEIVEVVIGERPRVTQSPAVREPVDTEAVPLKVSVSKREQASHSLVSIRDIEGLKPEGLPILLEKEIFSVAQLRPMKFKVDTRHILPERVPNDVDPVDPVHPARIEMDVVVHQIQELAEVPDEGPLNNL